MNTKIANEDKVPTERPAAGKSLLSRAAELETALEKLTLREYAAATKLSDRYQAMRKELIDADPEAYAVMRDAHGVGL